MNRERADLVIIGNGMAAARLVQELARLPGRPARILMIGGEPRPAYNRVLLSSLLAGDVAADVLPMHDENWYQENNIAVRCHDRVVQLDPAQRCLRTAQGLHVSYTQLVLATGARATLPEVPGIALDGVMGFRTLEDVAIMQDVAARGGHAVVVGGGLLGLEAAEGLRKQGMHVTVIHRSAHLLNRQLDAGAATLLRRTLCERGLVVHTGRQVRAIKGDTRCNAVILDDDTQLPADLVIFATGVTPEMSLAHEAGLHCDRAVCVDSQLRTSNAHIFALGECCQFEQHTYGLVAPIWHQARVLAQVLTGVDAHYSEQPVATQLKVSGITLFSCGDVAPPDCDALTYQDPDAGDYRTLWLRDGQLSGAVLYGDTRHGNWYFEQLLQRTPLTKHRAQLLFGPDALAGA